MKKVIVLGLVCLFFGATLIAQESLVLENGQYYTANKELVKGDYTIRYENGNKEASYTLENGVLNGQAVFYYNSGEERSW